MKNHWHEQIQRYVNGQASPAEAAALQTALNQDAELRALYLDYMNLDVALSAAAEMMTFNENSRTNVAAIPPPTIWSLLHSWRWLGATAAGAALVILVLFPWHRPASPAHHDIISAIASTQNAVARLTVESPTLFPAWASPTDAMFNQPRILKFDL